MNRYLAAHIARDLRDRKMAFIGGPRQVGKTTLAISFLKPSTEEHPAYLNWDDPKDRSLIMKAEIPLGGPLIVLDEVHKFARWRNLVKGMYDKHKRTLNIIVTGSARLDYYRKGGDSLQGRYHYFRLHPLSLTEMTARPAAGDLNALLRFGGFPEPLVKQDEIFSRRWHRERLQRVFQDDLRDLEHVREISLIELLMESLPERVGAPLSVAALRDTLEVSHQAVERWLDILERMYVCFRISPFGAPKIRAVKKERKLYLWDWSTVSEPGSRFENLVASQLLKYCHHREDTLGHAMELRYLRDTDKREVDFVVLQDGKPQFAVEAKTGEKSASAAAFYFRERTPIARFYQVHGGSKDYGNENSGVRVLPFTVFCRELAMP